MIAQPHPGRLLAALLLAAVAASLLLATGSASAATVEVEETVGTDGEAASVFATLNYRSEKDENNRLSIQVDRLENRMLDLRVVDNGAPLQAGSGCRGGGDPGAAVICAIREPRGPDLLSCGFKGCFQPVPGTGAIDSMRIYLGDGDNVFRGGELDGRLEHAFKMDVSAGAGSDWIQTGGGADRIAPGRGHDWVHSGYGVDSVRTTATPDGPDVYDLGTEYYHSVRYGADEVDYSPRSAPVVWNGFTGYVQGEGDRIEGAENVIGGRGDDVLRGNGYENFLVGGPGDDSIYGGYNWDVLMGSSGADKLHGGSEPDALLGRAGNDSLFGGTQKDFLECGDGWDRGLVTDTDRLRECEVQWLPDGVALTSSG